MLSNKIIIVTGGAGLLGMEFAKAILQNGGIPIIADCNKEAGLKAVKSLKSLFPSKEVNYQFLDINNKNSIKLLIHNIELKYNKIDALVNNAYPRNNNYGRKFEEVQYDDFCENISLNIGGYFLTSQLFSKYYLNQGFGDIVNISSIYGVVAPRFEIYAETKMTTPIEYAAIKSAVIHLTKYIAKYYKGKNIKVNSISPGGIYKNQPNTFLENYKTYTLNKGMLDASDISGTLIYLLSDFSKFVNGQNILVDDGFTL
jgi:NAD(P)-dependent dehydrogenase (short-subunit alcohol dehydrogenase family)